MQQQNLSATFRTEKGSRATRRLLRDGKVPAVLYGHELSEVSLTLDARTIEKIMGVEGYNGLVNLSISGHESLQSPVLALVKSHQAHPIKRHLMHLDFYKVNLNEAVQVKVPVHFTGTAIGVKEGGILDIERREVEISCLPNKIPEFIMVDVTPIALGHSLHAKDLVLSEGVTLVSDPEDTIVAILGKNKGAEGELEAAAAAEGTAESAETKASKES